MIEITIPGEPHAQGRPRAFAMKGKDGGTHVRLYDPKESRNWKATAQQHMQLAMRGAAPLDGPVRLEVRAYFTCPKSDHRKVPRPTRWHTKKPDGDNVLKAVKDAGKGVLWLDDSQVCLATIAKYIAAQGSAPLIHIKIDDAPATT